MNPATTKLSLLLLTFFTMLSSGCQNLEPKGRQPFQQLKASLGYLKGTWQSPLELDPKDKSKRGTLRLTFHPVELSPSTEEWARVYDFAVVETIIDGQQKSNSIPFRMSSGPRGRVLITIGNNSYQILRVQGGKKLNFMLITDRIIENKYWPTSRRLNRILRFQFEKPLDALNGKRGRNDAKAPETLLFDQGN